MMGNPRIIVWFALAFLLYVNWETWMRDYGPKPGADVPAVSSTPGAPGAAAPAPSLGDAIPQATPPAAGSAATPGEAPKAVESSGGGITANAAPTGGKVHVRTDVIDLDINLQGGTFDSATLLRYPKVKGQTELVELMNTSPETLYLLQTGLTSTSGEGPTHKATFASPQTDYQLGNASELRVPLTWTDGNGVTVTKTFVFKPGIYRIDLEYTIENKSGMPWAATPYVQILRQDPQIKRTMFTTNVDSYSFHGPALWDGTKYRKLKIDSDDDRKLDTEVSNGWIAALQHHFVGAVVFAPDTKFRVRLAAQGHEYLLSAVGQQPTSVAPGQSAKIEEKLFVGPKLQKQLGETGPELQRAADYGRLYILAQPLFYLLQKAHDLFGNWGWAIVSITFLLKLLFYPLSEASGRSMGKMKMLSPRIKALQESYKDDREKLGRAMMDLYKREKVNPVAGCVPMLIQIPVFLAFYWVLIESVEMRQAPFAAWIHDLSSRDPFFILPAIMAAAMFGQYKLQGTPGADPVQQKVFMFMPFVMSIMFAFFPAGLVLYWVTNTLLSIAQQWNINRRINAPKKT